MMTKEHSSLALGIRIHPWGSGLDLYWEIQRLSRASLILRNTHTTTQCHLHHEASLPTLIHAIRRPSFGLSYPNLASLAKTSGSNLIRNTVFSRCPFSISTLCAETRAGYKSQHGGGEAWEGGRGGGDGRAVDDIQRSQGNLLETAVACFMTIPTNGTNTLRSRFISRAAWK